MAAQKTCLSDIGLPGFLEYSLQGFTSALFHIVRNRNLSNSFQEILPVWRIPFPNAFHFFAQSGRVGLASQELIEQMEYGGRDAARPRDIFFKRNCQWTNRFSPDNCIQVIRFIMWI